MLGLFMAQLWVHAGDAASKTAARRTTGVERCMCGGRPDSRDHRPNLLLGGLPGRPGSPSGPKWRCRTPGVAGRALVLPRARHGHVLWLGLGELMLCRGWPGGAQFLGTSITARRARGWPWNWTFYRECPGDLAGLGYCVGPDRDQEYQEEYEPTDGDGCAVTIEWVTSESGHGPICFLYRPVRSQSYARSARMHRRGAGAGGGPGPFWTTWSCPCCWRATSRNQPNRRKSRPPGTPGGLLLIKIRIWV